MAVQVGAEAPDFTLPDQDRHPVTLSAHRGRPVVLAFFPKAFTPVCTTELGRFRDSPARFLEANAAVFGISVDPPETLKAFAAAERLDFPLLSDEDKTVTTAYGVLLEPAGISKRAVFVLDASGVVRHTEVTATPGFEPDYEKLNAALVNLG